MINATSQRNLEPRKHISGKLVSIDLSTFLLIRLLTFFLPVLAGFLLTMDHKKSSCGSKSVLFLIALQLYKGRIKNKGLIYVPPLALPGFGMENVTRRGVTHTKYGEKLGT